MHNPIDDYAKESKAHMYEDDDKSVYLSVSEVENGYLVTLCKYTKKKEGNYEEDEENRPKSISDAYKEDKRAYIFKEDPYEKMKEAKEESTDSSQILEDLKGAMSETGY